MKPWEILAVAACGANITHYLGQSEISWWGWFLIVTGIIYIVVAMIALSPHRAIR